MTEDRPNTAPSGVPDYQRSSHVWKPLLIVGAVLLVIAVFTNQPSSSLAENEDEATSSIGDFREVAVMGGVRRKNLSDDFRGGTATAVMGGVDIDLRNSTMDRREVVLDVSSVMGGVKIQIPENWTVVSQVNTVMGGYKDHTHHPKDSVHRLILKGTVVMGGLSVSN